MNDQQVIDRFRKSGALLEGHFVLSSGLHSSVYLQCAIALQATADAIEFGAALAAHFNRVRSPTVRAGDSSPWLLSTDPALPDGRASDTDQIETVASPAIGGLVIGYETARQLGVRFIWTEREQGQMKLRRGFSVRQGERILVVEDVITTGGSTRDTIAALQDLGASVVAAASIIDRSAGTADVGVPRVSLATLNVSALAASECGACARGEPVTKPGSRAV
ncbi:MAG: orotate phosphoribosyltransferase [Pyrinomonadaceae bacterium]